MNLQVCEFPFPLLLEFERERLRLCHEALRRSASTRQALAWAAAVLDAEQREHQLLAICRDNGLPTTSAAEPCPLEQAMQALARNVVAELEHAFADASFEAKVAPSATAPSSDWELRVG